jgi:hypothetical protein
VNSLFSKLTLADVHQDVTRNIVSLRASQDLFDDLTDDPAEWSLAQKVESEVRPPQYRSHTPVIDRPFEDAKWFSAIIWPFKHWQASRFSDGTYGVWFGSDSVSNPRFNCQLTYRLEGDMTVIEKQPGVAWITLAVSSFS